MALCDKACCNAEARRAKEAAEAAETARKRAEFEAYWTAREAAKAAAGTVPGLTETENARLNEWLARHPQAVG